MDKSLLPEVLATQIMQDPRDLQKQLDDLMIENLRAQIATLTELVTLQDNRDGWFQPMYDEIIKLRGEVEDLRRLLGLETDAAVTRSKVEELREKLSVKGMATENRHLDAEGAMLGEEPHDQSASAGGEFTGEE